MTAGELLMEFLCHCTPFAELDYEYLVVVCRNDQGKVMLNGFRISKDFLKKLKIVIDTGDATLAEQLTPPFPEEVTTQIMECFEYQYEILMPVGTGYEGMDRIAELLWAFSKSQEELSNDYDTEYRRRIECNLKTEILNLLKSFKLRIPKNDYIELSQLCNNVFNGQRFNDANFNSFCETLIIKSQEQVQY